MKDDRDTSELQSRNAHPGLQATLLWEVLCLYMWWQQELCVSVKLNKQVNKIPWLSVTQECVEVDRCELMCCIGCYLCGGRLRPAGWNSEVPPIKVVFGLLLLVGITCEWMLVHYSQLWASFYSQTELDQRLLCQVGVGWADGVGACDWERCHGTCGHSLWWTPLGTWIMYTVGLSDGWCNNARQNSVTRKPSQGQRLNQPASQHIHTYQGKGMYLASSLLLDSLSSAAVGVKLFCFALTSETFM